MAYFIIKLYFTQLQILVSKNMSQFACFTLEEKAFKVFCTVNWEFVWGID